MTAVDPGNFGADEIARARPACLKQDGSVDTAIDSAFLKRVTAGLELVDLLDACARGPQSNLFLAWSKKGSALLPAYQVYLTLLAGGDSAVDAALDHPVAKARKRAPSRKNVALLAITLSHNPASPEDQKAASDYACVLIMAAVHTIEPSRFLEWLSWIGLSECRKAVRDLRRDPKKRTTAQGESTDAEESSTANSSHELGGGREETASSAELERQSGAYAQSETSGVASRQTASSRKSGPVCGPSAVPCASLQIIVDAATDARIEVAWPLTVRGLSICRELLVPAPSAAEAGRVFATLAHQCFPEGSGIHRILLFAALKHMPRPGALPATSAKGRRKRKSRRHPQDR